MPCITVILNWLSMLDKIVVVYSCSVMMFMLMFTFIFDVLVDGIVSPHRGTVDQPTNV